ncbi:type II secretion system F family protein [Acidithiobacillus sp. M4-SHS-6]|uniref:type II secretion system F family protein n=1 Tax=Acidithiobacillus sp. M4-SHS-6 TaxID=3383024 RepID=UPI0039BE1F65
MFSLSALLIALAVAALSLAVGLLIFFRLHRFWMLSQTQASLQRVEPRLQGDASGDNTATIRNEVPLARRRGMVPERLARWGTAEDRRQLLQAGYRSRRAPALFIALRIGLGLLLALAALVIIPLAQIKVSGPMLPIVAFIALAIGYLIPKFVLEAQAHGRRDRINGELPFFVDMLALLQGVGLSLEQSLMSVAGAGEAGIPLLASEMQELNKQIAIGRPRIEAMQKLAEMLQDPDFQELVNMLRQIDRFGGEVTQPLREFAERLQEKRHMALRERAGRMNVKMTLVLVLTMLPGLVIITVGPAMLLLVKFMGRF